MVTIVIGLGFGDEGKGNTTQHYCINTGAKCVVRFNGGAQAGHNVRAYRKELKPGTQWHDPENEVWHTFSQFGSGTFYGAETFLSRFVVFDPVSLCFENKLLAELVQYNPLRMVHVASLCPVVTPIHVAANRIRDQILGKTSADGSLPKKKYRSCGRGIGEVMALMASRPDLTMRVGDFATNLGGGNPQCLLNQLREIQQVKAWSLKALGANLEDFGRDGALLLDQTEPEKIMAALSEIMERVTVVCERTHLQKMLIAGNVVFEGAQGVLLDEWHGFDPFTTWSSCTAKNAIQLLDEAGYGGPRKIIGATRTFLTRHGDGPFPSEQPQGVIKINGERNTFNDHQGAFRVGNLDLVLLRYAIECVRLYSKLDGLALTHMDQVNLDPIKYGFLQVVTAHEHDSQGLVDYIKPNKDQNLSMQQQLTRLLWGFRPDKRRTVAMSNSGELVNLLIKETGIPIHYQSFNP